MLNPRRIKETKHLVIEFDAKSCSPFKGIYPSFLLVSGRVLSTRNICTCCQQE